MKITELNAKVVYKKVGKSDKEALEARFGIDFFQPNIDDEIKDIHDIYRILKIKEEDVIIFKKPKNKFEKYINACAIIPKIVEVYNQGWIPDFDNRNILKYLPYFMKSGLGWTVGTSYGWTVGSAGPGGHHYRSREMCKRACLKFTNIYNDYHNG